MKTKIKSTHWHVGMKVQHNYSDEIGYILQYRKDKTGYNWLVEFHLDDGKLIKDWYKEEALEKVEDGII